MLECQIAGMFGFPMAVHIFVLLGKKTNNAHLIVCQAFLFVLIYLLAIYDAVPVPI